MNDKITITTSLCGSIKLDGGEIVKVEKQADGRFFISPAFVRSEDAEAFAEALKQLFAKLKQ